MSFTWEELEAVVRQRAAADPAQSWTAKLVASGIPRIARKTGEEAVETVVAALAEDDAALAGEAADLVYHLTVLLHARGLGVADVMAVLEARQGRSGLVEKAGRPTRSAGAQR